MGRRGGERMSGTPLRGGIPVPSLPSPLFATEEKCEWRGDTPLPYHPVWAPSHTNLVRGVPVVRSSWVVNRAKQPRRVARGPVCLVWGGGSGVLCCPRPTDSLIGGCVGERGAGDGELRSKIFVMKSPWSVVRGPRARSSPPPSSSLTTQSNPSSFSCLWTLNNKHNWKNEVFFSQQTATLLFHPQQVAAILTSLKHLAKKINLSPSNLKQMGLGRLNSPPNPNIAATVPATGGSGATVGERVLTDEG